jgi:phosphinothricin acetyltransferase
VPAVELTLRTLSAADWPVVREIYAAGIATGDATFETDAGDWAGWDGGHLGEPRLAALVDGTLVGWAALSAVSDRCAYAGVAEVSLYVAATARRRGVGRALLSALVEASERCGIWTLQAGIFPENAASLALHAACAFRVVGRRDRLGQLNGRWRDVLLLERRSTAVGGCADPAHA